MRHPNTKTSFFRKLLFGRPEDNIQSGYSVIRRQRLNLYKVWNNETHNDIGLEKMVRLFLIVQQFLYPGIYIRNSFGRQGSTYKKLAIEFYVLLKLAFPLFSLFTGWYSNSIIQAITGYLLLETIFYIATLFFASEIFDEPRSSKRSILLLFLNYIEITFDFAVIYGGLNLLQGKAHSRLDFVYFSFMTSSTIGFGDIYPATSGGNAWSSFIRSYSCSSSSCS
ncbi:ion channel [Puia sp. P3]|uniref:ion channel n=1 Tax=Puia sp. P3 TaxID=3423952 RepID=UPI003D67C6FB